MIPFLVLNGPFLIAQGKSIDTRLGCARTGMVQALDEFRVNSCRTLANRRADGLSDIDRAVAALRNSWVPQGGAGPANEGTATALLTACADWLNNRRICGMRVTGWREPSIQALYWEAAWCYSCDNYAKRAWDRVRANNLAGQATSLEEPVLNIAQGGNPYSAGYTFSPVAAALYRGDTRGPLSIQAANGFQGLNIGARAAFAPWFGGHATGDTISTTTDESLAVNAVGGALATGLASPQGPLPAWLAGAVAGVVPAPSAVRGFVYEFGNFGATTSTRVSTQIAGREEVFLGLPNATIVRWWAVLADHHTVGPFPYPAAVAAPAMVNYSANPMELA